MLFSILTAVLPIAANSQTLSTRQSNQIATFDFFGERQCYHDYLGTEHVPVDGAKPRQCHAFGGVNPIGVNLTSIEDGCKLTLYDDNECKTTAYHVKVFDCYSSSKGWRGWIVTCVDD